MPSFVFFIRSVGIHCLVFLRGGRNRIREEEEMERERRKKWNEIGGRNGMREEEEIE